MLISIISNLILLDILINVKLPIYSVNSVYRVEITLSIATVLQYDYILGLHYFAERYYIFNIIKKK